MNKITSAQRENFCGERCTKSFEILITDSGEKAIVVPPLKKYSINYTGIRIVFDSVLLPFNEICTVYDDADGAMRFTAEQAVKYFENHAPKRHLILTALSNLLISYITAFGSKKEFSPVVELVRTEIAKGVSDCTFSIRDCLKKLHLNYAYIRKLFKK